MQLTQRLLPSSLVRSLAMMFFGVLLCAVASPMFAAEAAGTDRSWGAFFGRTHVLFLHLPIGLLVGAFVIEFFGLFKRSKGFDVAAAWLFVLGFISSIGAVVTGLLLGTEQATDKSLTIFTLLFADTGEGVSDTLSLHMWLGLTMMVVAGVAAILKIIAVRKQWKDADSAIPERGGWPLGMARVSLVGVMVAMPLVGHLGGNMTHGPEYLTERAPSDAIVAGINLMNLGTVEEKDDEPVVVTDEQGNELKVPQGTAAFWKLKIQPVMNNHCTACHNDQKQNGGLRLDTLEWAMKGGELAGASNVIAYDYELKSELYRRVVLPHSHDEHMPTNKKKYGIMSQQDIHMLGEWLMEFDGSLDSGLAKPGGEDAATEQQTEATPEPVKPIIAPETLAAITSAGGSAQSLSQEENAEELTVKFAYLKDLDPAVVAKLESGADKIAWLTFEGSAFGDQAAKALPAMDRLTRLNLKDTAITDAGLAELPEMASLTWLNLFGTEISDAGLESLQQYDLLEKLYLTGTKVTADGVAKLREAMPSTEIFSDHDGQFQFTPVTPDVTPGDPAKDDKAAAKPVNDKCPVSGAPIKNGFVSTFEGKTVGFCCNNCKGKFDADPSKFAAKLQ